MSITTAAAISSEFVDILTAQLLLAPDPAFVFSKLAMAARYGEMDIPGIVHASGVAANMAEAMGQAAGTLDLNPQFMRLGADFVKRIEETSTGPGKVFLIDRPVYMTAGIMTEAARRLTDGTPISSTVQAISMDQVSLTCREYGGPHSGSEVQGIGITEFLLRRSKHDLVAYLGLLLRRDCNAWLDSVLSNLLLTSSHITYASGAANLSTATAGSNPLTDDDLAAVKLALQTRNIPTFSDGNYMLVVSPQHEADLRKDDQFREIVRYQGVDGPLTSGQFKSFNGFSLITSNNIVTAGVGSGGSVTGYQALAFGPGALGWGSGMDAVARLKVDTDFGRQSVVAWLSQEAFGLLNEDFVQVLQST